MNQNVKEKSRLNGLGNTIKEDQANVNREIFSGAMDKICCTYRTIKCINFKEEISYGN